MDRRTFTRTLPVAALGVIACGRDTPIGPEPATPGPPTPPPPPPPPPPQYATAEERAYGVVANLVNSAERDATGARWAVTGSSGHTYPSDLYDGQAGVLAFLAEAYRMKPDDALRRVLEDGGRWLRARPPGGTRGIFDGSAGRAWAFLSMHEALGAGSGEWLQAALALAPGVASGPSGLPGDIINGPPGQGLLLLRLREASGDTRWLDAARGLADTMLTRAVPAGDGIKIPSFNDPSGVPVCYTGLAHGSAGAGYFLCRLAQSLPASQRARYADGAAAIAAWLDGLAQLSDDGVHWYRREPDQMHQLQVTWCHGPPGIGIFYAELHRLTGLAQHLEMAQRCANTTERSADRLSLACQCHGHAGNAQIFFKLYRQTGSAAWLEKARAFGDLAWTRRFPSRPYPTWPSGGGAAGVANPGLMTGDAGVGWFYLQLGGDGSLPMPVTP